jgi:glycosyltransferase involved in cell wall biosynthesis
MCTGKRVGGGSCAPPGRSVHNSAATTLAPTSGVPPSVAAAGSGERIRLALLSTHPVQYHSHWFRALFARPELDLSVFYCYHASPTDQARAGFGVEFDWDIPLLEGYRYNFLNGDRPKPGSFFAVAAAQMVEVLARRSFDAVLINGWHYKAAWQTIFTCWKLQIPVMVRGDSQLPSPRHPLKRLLKYPAYRYFIPRFDACLAVGTRSREYYLHYGAALERVFLVPHAIQDDLFQQAGPGTQTRRPELRRQWGLGERETVFLFAGKFIARKRPMDFLQAIEAAFQGERRVAALMVGDGPLRPACEQFASSRKLPVRFAGFLNQSQMVEAYVAADCLVLPSDGRETWGLVVNEAMSCSRPAIVSDAVGCAPDLVRDGRTGAVFPLADVKALGKILLAFSRDPARLLSMGECAREGLRHYSLEAAVQGAVDAVEAVVWSKRKR